VSQAHGLTREPAHPRTAQEANAKAAKDLEAMQEAAGKERARLESLAEQLKARRADLAAQVGLCVWLLGHQTGPWAT